MQKSIQTLKMGFRTKKIISLFFVILYLTGGENMAFLISLLEKISDLNISYSLWGFYKPKKDE